MKLENFSQMFRKIFFPISILYFIGAITRRYLYKSGILKQKKLPIPVISVGNLSVGGTGKTPITISIAKYLKSKNLKVAVLTRGYKRKSKDENFLCKVDMDYTICGDESYLMTKKGFDVYVGKDRYKSAIKVYKEYDIFLLDDGFQHFQLYRDLNILVVDVTKPFWNDNLLPEGNLREPKSFYKFADAFLITRFNHIKNKGLFIQTLKKYNKPFFIAEEKIEKLVDTDFNEIELSFLTGKTFIVISGIGNNKQFFDSVKELSQKYKFNISDFIRRPDHYDYKNFKFDSNKLYLTTEKDIIKIKNKNVYAVSYELEFQKDFYNFVWEKIYGSKSNRYNN